MADPTGGQIGQSYFELPAHDGELAWAELEVPWGHTGDLAQAELEVPSVASSGQIAVTELETPLVATAGEIAVTDLTTPFVATAGQMGWGELIVPFFPTAGQAGWAELELRKAQTAGRLSIGQLQVPAKAAVGILGQGVLRVPKSYAASFVQSNGTVDIFRTAELEALQSAGQITRIDITSSGVLYTDANAVVVTAEHSSNSSLAQDAVLSAQTGALTVKSGTYLTTKGFLSADKYLQDEFYYNDHTYVVRVAESFDRWESIYKKVLHPAGFHLIGEFVAVMVPQQFTLDVEDATVDVT